MATKILIVDDHQMVREAISCLLDSEMGLEVVGQAPDGRAAVELARELAPDVVLMDIAMPNLNGIEATRQMIRQNPAVRIIAMSGFSDRRCVREMLKAGACGYVPKNCDFHELVTAIRNVASNKTHLSSQVSGIVVGEYLGREAQAADGAYSVLTPREREVLQLIAEGKSTKQIAKELFVSTKTVEWHRSQLMNKLDLQSIAELVKYAISEGLTCASL